MEDGRTAIAEIVPYIVPFTPVTASCASSPALISATEVASTVALTIHEFVLMTSISDDDEAELAADPVPEPPEPEPPEPEPPDPEPPEPDPETCSPTVRPTLATTPLIGDVSVAPASAVLAELSAFCAAVRAAWSAVSCAAETSVSPSTLAWSAATVALFCATVAASDAESIVASFCPFETVCPTVAVTEVTTPDDENPRVSSVAGASVPLAVTVCRRVPVLTVCVVVVTCADAGELPLLATR